MGSGKEVIYSKNLFLLGLPKSGTSLLMTLLDSHSDILSLPVESRYFKLKKQLLEQNDRIEHIVAFVTEQSGFATFNLESEKFKLESNNSKKNYIDSLDYKLFENRLKIALETRQFPLSIKSLFEVTTEAYVAAKKEVNSQYTYKYLAEKTPGNEFFFQEIVKSFPDTKFIHIFRHPLDNIASFFAYQDGRKVARSYSFCIKILQSANVYLKNIDNKDYHFLTYEDLVSDTESQMKSVAKFLDIPFHNSLLKPTIAGGIRWGGNSSVNKIFSGRAESSQVRSYAKRLSRAEIIVLKKFFGFSKSNLYSFTLSTKDAGLSQTEKIKIIILYIYSRLVFRRSLSFLKNLYKS